jgi:serine protease AprX
MWVSTARADLSPSVRTWLDDAPGDEIVTVWVFFGDKGDYSPVEMGDRVGQAGMSLDPRAIQRRFRARPARPFDERDLPLHRPYVRSLEEEGVEFRAFSRWLNAVSVRATADELRRISGLPFVTKITRVSGRRGGPEPVLSRAERSVGGSLTQYGHSRIQLDIIQVPDLHAEGYTGTGVRIAIFDTGFWLDHESLLGVNVIAEHDFINDDGVTANEPGDPEYQHFHGTQCLSLLAGDSPGLLIGAACDAEYLLAKTEDTSQEEPIEEDWWIEAVEWADSLGVQIISSSLCYNDWYTYEDMDGDTAPITIAADMAVLNGIVVANAAGNSGASSWKYMLAPADGDSVICVGSVDSTGVRSSWSSQGPTSDGRIKPTIMAMGESNYIADPIAPDAYRRGSGTSFATPLAVGAMALILQKNPEWGPPHMLDAITATGTRSSDPDTLYGWGILQALDASNYDASGIIAANSATPGLIVYPNPSGGSVYLLSTVEAGPRQARVYDVRGRLLGLLDMDGGAPVSIDLNSMASGPGLFFIEAPGLGRTKVLVLK